MNPTFIFSSAKACGARVPTSIRAQASKVMSMLFFIVLFSNKFGLGNTGTPYLLPSVYNFAFLRDSCPDVEREMGCTNRGSLSQGKRIQVSWLTSVM